MCVGEWDSQKGPWREGIPALTQRRQRPKAVEQRLSGEESKEPLLPRTLSRPSRGPTPPLPQPGFPCCREGGRKAREDSPVSRRLPALPGEARGPERTAR